MPSPRHVVGAMADRLQAWNRARKARWLVAFVQHNHARTGLMVGCGGDDQPWENQVERAAAAQLELTVWCGIDPRSTLPGYVVCDGRALPFRDASFDVVFSNAVVEHVGDRHDQQRFVAEHARVGTSWACTTPNRCFPAEAHTRTVLWHFSASWRAKRPEFTRLLSRRELRDLLPADADVVGGPLAPTFTAATSCSESERPRPAAGKPRGEPKMTTRPQLPVLTTKSV